jgi:rod shape-determining protein MreD
MFRYIIFILLAFLVALLEISFLPNFRIYGGMLNLPFLVLALNFYLTGSPRKGRRTLLWAFILGIFVDLLSGGVFLSATITLFILALLLEASRRLVSFEGQNPLAALPVFAGAVLFDLLYLLFNRVTSWNASVLLPILFDGLITAFVYLLAISVYGYFQPRHRLTEIKLQ